MDTPVGPPVPGQLDVVYPVRRALLNEQLRFSLRSLVNLPHRGVWLFGDAPAWVDGVEKVKIRQNQTKWENTTPAMLAAASSSGVSDPFVWFNDDFYVLTPADDVPTFHHGPLEDHAQRFQDAHPNSGYAKALRDAVKWLRRQGIECPLSYELHVPIVLHKAQVLEHLERMHRHLAAVKRSVIGNLANLGGQYLGEDVKGPDMPSGPFVSTGRRTWAGPVGATVRAAFPERSQHERIGTGGPDSRSWTPAATRGRRPEPRVRVASRRRPVPRQPARPRRTA